MATYGFMVPILPGQEDADRRLSEELAGPRRAEYEASRRRLGWHAERVWLQTTPQGSVAVFFLEADDIERVFTGLATSTDPFDVWWREQIQQIHGMDLTQPLPGPPNEQILNWTDS